MQKVKPRFDKKKYQEIAQIPAFQPIQCISDEQKFLNPSNENQMWYNIHLLMNFYNRGGCLSPQLVSKIIKKSISIINPIHIVGDIHGQFYDLMEHLQKIGIYSLIVNNNKNLQLKRRKVLFLGDYVDRGNFSVEVTLLLLTLKIYLPKTFYLLRGNHECRQITQVYNFRRECSIFFNLGQSKYKNQDIYNLFIEMFWVLPLAAIVNGTYFCVHGGLSQDLKSISDIEKISRFKEIPRKGLMCDLLWSDPVDDKAGKVKEEKDSEFNKNRNCSIKFGQKMTSSFFRRNQIMCIIRAHEVQMSGFGFKNWGEKDRFPDIITLFSAPNYCGSRNNGAIACIEVIAFKYLKRNEIDIFSIEKKSEPFVFPNFINGFQLSVPFMIAYVTEMFFCLLSPSTDIEQKLEQAESARIFQISPKFEGRKDLKRAMSKNSSRNYYEKDEILEKIREEKRNQELLIEERIMEKQEYLLDVYSGIKGYIKENISFKQKMKDSLILTLEAKKSNLTL